MDLTEFLAARLDEDEAVAKACADYDALSFSDLPGVHKTTARALREVTAHRRILAFVASIPQPEVSDPVLGWLAEVYSNHPDYRAEWSP